MPDLVDSEDEDSDGDFPVQQDWDRDQRPSDVAEERVRPAFELNPGNKQVCDSPLMR